MKKLVLLCTIFFVLSGHSQVWRPMPDGPLNGDVFAITRFGSYMWIGGSFSSAGSTSASFVVRHNGVQWVSTPSLPNPPFDFCIFNNELYAIGGFDVAGLRYAVMKWSGTGWIPLAQILLSEYGRSAAVFNNELVIGGRFSSVDGQTTPHLVRFNGVSWLPFSGVTTCGWQAVPDVRAVFYANGYLYVGGAFDQICGIAAACAAKWDGTTWTPLPVGINTYVSDFEIFNGDVYVCGIFPNAGASSSQAIAKEGPSDWISVGSGVKMNAQTMAVHKNKLYIAGLKEPGSGDDVGNCGYTPNSSNWFPDNTGINANTFETIHVIYEDPITSALYAGGDFNTGSGNVANYLAYNREFALPIHLSSFSGVFTSEGKVRLDWRDETPADGQWFDVQYSTDGQNFISIGRVDERSARTEYSWSYIPKECGKVFFRLSYEGKYSNVVSIAVPCTGSTIVQAGQRLTVWAVSAGTFEIWNTSGQLLYSRALPKGSNVQQINLPHGIYVARFTSLSEFVSAKVVF